MKLAIASCSNLPGWEIDDEPFWAALTARGVVFEQCVWDDPSIDWSVFDGCIIRTTWDYMEKRPAYIAWAERIMAQMPLFNPAPVVAWNTHKRYLADLEANGVRIAPTAWFERGERVDVAALMAARGWRRGFIKPMIGATARETLRFDADEAGLRTAQAHIERTLAAEGMMIQPYLPRVEVDGEISAIFIDGQVSHTVQKVPVAGDYRVQDDWGATDHPYPFSKEELALSRRVVETAQRVCPGHDGSTLLYARVDFLWDEAGELCVTEVELVEPSLFFRHDPGAAKRLVEALCRRLANA